MRFVRIGFLSLLACGGMVARAENAKLCENIIARVSTTTPRSRIERSAPKSKPERNLYAQDRLLDYLALDNVTTIPVSSPDKLTKKVPLTEVLGVPQSTFVGTSAEAENLNASRLEAMQRTRARLDTRVDISEPARKKITQILDDEIVKLKFQALSPEIKNRVVQDKLLNHLARDSVKGLPQSYRDRATGIIPMVDVLGVPQDRVFGYATSGEIFNASRLEFMERARAKLDKRVDIVDPALKKITKILDDEIASLKFDNLPNEEKNLVVQDRLINALAKDGVDRIPSSVADKKTKLIPINLVLGIPYGRFFGSAKDGVLNKSRLEAFTKTLAQLQKRTDLSDTARAQVRSILENEIAKLSQQ